MVTSIAAGSGWQSDEDSMHAEPLRWRGMAPKALLSPIGSFSLDEGHYGDVNNHSHGSGDYYGGYYYAHVQYDDDAAIDLALSCHDTTERSAGASENNIIVYGAGNSGNTQVNSRMQGFYSLCCAAKNAIKVGSVDKQTAVHSYASSMGPTYDGRVGPHVLVPTYKPDRYDAWTVEIDYIVLSCDTDTVAWDFDDMKNDSSCDSLYWGCGMVGMQNLRRGEGDTTISFGAYQRSCMYSDTFDFPSDPGARLHIRYRMTDSIAHPVIRKGDERYAKACLHWRTSTSNLDNPYAAPLPDGVLFYLRINAGWQEAEIPLASAHQLTADQMGYGNHAWTAAIGTIRRISFGFTWPAAVFVASHRAWYNDGMYLHEDFEGTSSSAPQVTGVVALMLEKHARANLLTGQNIHDDPFWNSTARALLIHTATDLVDTVAEAASCAGCCPPEFLRMGDTVYSVATVGPDYATGWGLANAAKAIAYVDSNFAEDTVDDHQLRYYSMHVPQGTPGFRITVAWDDPPPDGLHGGDNGYAPKLVNDLDVYAIPPAGDSVYRPWFLDHTPIRGRTTPYDPAAPTAVQGIDSSLFEGDYHIGISVDTVLAYPAKPGRDGVNVEEVIDVAAPDTGFWTVVVEGRDLLKNQSLNGAPNWRRQEFSLVYDLPCAADGESTDGTGPQLIRGGDCVARGTSLGYLQLGGHPMYSSPEGIVFGDACGIDTLGNLLCDSLLTDQATWLDVQANLGGGLVLRSPEGTVTTHIAADGTVRVRRATVEGGGVF